MKIHSESLVKLEILTRGVAFSENALRLAELLDAKGQNMVYNLPQGCAAFRPQELLIESEEHYITVCSCVSMVPGTQPVFIDVDHQNELIATINGDVISNARVRYVKQPCYYNRRLNGGEKVKQYVSACGYDELNILPWRGCAISQGCKFCGINSVTLKEASCGPTAFDISRCPEAWDKYKDWYLSQLKTALGIAVRDECYKEHAHVIFISGNLADDSLDIQAEIFCQIVKNVRSILESIATEGIVAVITPPRDSNILVTMKHSGIDIVVFNLEVGNEPWFSKYCPGKASLGRDFFLEKLFDSVAVFGAGRVWSNFVLGLEPVGNLLDVCHELAQSGVVCGANILHLDKGHSLDCGIPDRRDVLDFYSGLAEIYREFGQRPYYCSRALRTSLINEFCDGRIKG